MNTCEYCNKNFSSKSNLLYHINKTKRCIENRNIEIINDEKIFKCNYCDKTLSSKNRLECHKEICVGIKFQNKLDELVNNLEIYKVTINEKDTLIEQQRLQILEQKDMIKNLQDRLQHICEKAVSKPTTVNNNNKSDNHSITNTYNHLQPVNLSHDYLYQVLDKNLKLEHIYQGQIGLANVVAQKLLTDESGRPIAFCNDKSRQVIKYKNEDGEIVKDSRAYNLVSSIAPIAEEIAFKRKKEFESIYYPKDKERKIEEVDEDEEEYFGFEDEDDEDYQDFLRRMEEIKKEKEEKKQREKVENIINDIREKQDWDEEKKSFYLTKLVKGITDYQILNINANNFSKQLSMILPAEKISQDLLRMFSQK